MPKTPISTTFFLQEFVERSLGARRFGVIRDSGLEDMPDLKKSESQH